jgi:hypothetical protein
MRFRFRRLITAALLVAAAVLVVPGALQAQIRQLPYGNTGQPVSQTFAILGNAATVGQARYLASPARFYGAYGGGYGGYGGGYGGYGWNPWYPYPYYDYSLGNTLQGVASVVNAEGQLGIQNQQAKLLQQEHERSKIDTRRKQFDEYLYEQSMTPTPEDIRQRMMQEELRRMRNDPPPSDIWSGAALNTILKAVQKEEASLGIKGPAIPIDPNLVKDLNLSGGATGGGIGALKAGGGQLTWPAFLQKTTFDADRKKIDGLSDQVVRQAAAGRVNGETLLQLQDAVLALKAKVKSDIEGMSPSENVKANRFCNDLLDGVRSMEDPAAVNYFNGKWDAKAATVPELVDQMTRQGLMFGPAVAGQESAYNAVYRALVNYDMSLAQMTYRLQSPGRPPAQQ